MGSKISNCSDFRETGVKLFAYTWGLRKIILCTTSDITIIGLVVEMR